VGCGESYPAEIVTTDAHFGAAAPLIADWSSRNEREKNYEKLVAEIE
jgi:hypothetical protein